MSQKKYLSLEEAAQRLGMSLDDMKKLREKGDVRGFADRGTWKFKFEDVEEMARRRQANSDPDLPFLVDDPVDGDSAISMMGEDVGDQPTIIRGNKPGSDIKLESGDIPLPGRSSRSDFKMDSDSDINLTKEWGTSNQKPGSAGPPPKGAELDSDSDVKLVEEPAEPKAPAPKAKPKMEEAAATETFILDSDSDVKLVDESFGRPATPFSRDLKGSDSDIRLAPTDENVSDVRFAPPGLARFAKDSNATDENASDVRFAPQEAPSDSDVALLRPGDSSIALDFTPDEGEGASVLSDESGIALASDSAMMLASESGISLEGPSDSGISLESRNEEGITLADDAGLSLLGADSGISLDSGPGSSVQKKPARGGGTLPMMDIAGYKDDVSDTSFEIPSLQDDSAYEMKTTDSAPKKPSKGSKAPAFSSSESVDDAVFNIDDGDAELDSSADDDLEVVDDAFGEDDDLGEDLDVIDADEEVFAADDEEGEFASPVASGRYVPVEQEWGAGVMVGVSLCSVLLLLVGAVMFDLVKTMWTPGQANAVAGPVLDALGGLYK